MFAADVFDSEIINNESKSDRGCSCFHSLGVRFPGRYPTGARCLTSLSYTFHPAWVSKYTLRVILVRKRPLRTRLCSWYFSITLSGRIVTETYMYLACSMGVAR